MALLGARQVGKSYLLKEVLKEHRGVLISMDDSLERREAAEDPVKYLEKRFRPGDYLFIDEAARVPEIFSAVKILVDRYDPKPTGICLANSGNYLLMRRIKESLAGRVNLLEIYPLSWQEFGGGSVPPGLLALLTGGLPKKIQRPFSSVAVKRAREERLVWGGFPQPSLDKDREASRLWIRDYIRTYILPLVVEQFGIRDTFAFEQAARSLMLRSAQYLNGNQLAQTIGASQPTAMNYVHCLEAMMVIQRVPIFFRNMEKRLVKQPKIYACDPLLIHEVWGTSFSVSKASENNQIGMIYETFVFNEIQKILTNDGVQAEIFSWRTQDQAEVDLILSSSGNLIPLEVKWSQRPTRRDTSGLASFLSTHPEAKQGYIVYPGEEVMHLTEKITAIPDAWLFGYET